MKNGVSKVYTDRPDYADFDSPAKFEAIKSIIAKRQIKKGEAFTLDNLTTKRPGNGISPMRWNEVLGMIASRNFAEDELIEL